LALVAVVLAAMAFRLPGLDPTLTDHDTWRQTDTATIARNFLEEPRILWPRVNWGAPGPGYVEAEFQLYTFATSLLYRIFGENPLYGRILTLLVSAISCLVFFRISRRFFDPKLALMSVSIYAMAPLLFRYSYVFMPDATCILFSLIALERFLAFLDDDRWLSVLSSGVAMTLAILVKPTAIHLGLVFAILAVAKKRWRSIIAIKPLTFAVVSLLPVVGYYDHAASIHETYGNTFGVISGGDSKWGTLALRLDPRLYFNLAFIESAWTVGPVGVLLAIVGFFSIRTRDWRALVIGWAATTFLYYFIVARYAGDEKIGLQYHLYAVPLVALLTAAGWSRVSRHPKVRAWLAFLLFAGVIGYQVVADVLILAKPRHEHMSGAGRALAAASGPEDLALVLSEDAAGTDVPNNFEQPDVLFHARRRGRLLPADRQTRKGLEESLIHGIKWFVNFPARNQGADASFHAFVRERMALVTKGKDFEIYSVRPNRSGAQ
jgi:4-amino-4-deoxy-L-arabinose transferase-like glycosyltransferase